MASTNAFLTLYSTVQTNLVGSTITTGYIPYISTAGRQAYSNTLSTLTVSTLTSVSTITSNVNCSTLVTSTISGAMREPTVKVLTASFTTSYTPTAAGVVRIRVRMCGGGGSGASYLTDGNPGTATSFAGWTCARGEAGAQSGNGGAGGFTSNNTGTGTLIVRLAGGSGTGYQNTSYINGGSGGSNPFGGGGGGGGNGRAGIAGAANTGAGGGGAGGYAGNAGSGGGSGEYLEFYITNPSAYSITYNVGQGGIAVTHPGGWASGAGAAGTIIVEEFYI